MAMASASVPVRAMNRADSSTSVKTSAAAHPSQFGFYIDACGVRQPDDEPGLLGVLFERQFRAVEHDRRESLPDGPDAGFDTPAVVEVDGDGDFRIAGRPQEYRGHQLHRSFGELHFGQLQNDRRMQLLGRGDGPHDVFDAQAVEGPDGVASPESVSGYFSEWNQHDRKMV